VAGRAVRIIAELTPGQERKRASAVARLHKVNASGTTHTFRFEAGSQRLLGIGAVIGGIGCLAFVVAALAYPSSSWAQGGSTPGAILLTGLGLFVLWSGIRLIRMGVQVSAGR